MQAVVTGSPKPPTPPSGSPEDLDNQEMDLLEFIRTVDRESQEVRQIVAKDSGCVVSHTTLAKAKSSSIDKDKEKRKLSEEGVKILKPSLRMKAFKGRRQDTFHSLDAYVREPTSTNGPPSPGHEDVLRMPAIEGIRISSPSITSVGGRSNHKVYHKIHSDPAIALKANFSGTGSNSSFGSNSNKPKKQLVLHTIPQPDGGVIGYHTEVEVSANKSNNVRK